MSEVEYPRFVVWRSCRLNSLTSSNDSTHSRSAVDFHHLRRGHGLPLDRRFGAGQARSHAEAQGQGGSKEQGESRTGPALEPEGLIADEPGIAP